MDSISFEWGLLKQQADSTLRQLNALNLSGEQQEATTSTVTLDPSIFCKLADWVEEKFSDRKLLNDALEEFNVHPRLDISFDSVFAHVMRTNYPGVDEASSALETDHLFPASPVASSSTPPRKPPLSHPSTSTVCDSLSQSPVSGSAGLASEVSTPRAAYPYQSREPSVDMRGSDYPSQPSPSRKSAAKVRAVGVSGSPLKDLSNLNSLDAAAAAASNQLASFHLSLQPHKPLVRSSSAPSAQCSHTTPRRSQLSPHQHRALHSPHASDQTGAHGMQSSPCSSHVPGIQEEDDLDRATSSGPPSARSSSPVVHTPTRHRSLGTGSSSPLRQAPAGSTFSRLLAACGPMLSPHRHQYTPTHNTPTKPPSVTSATLSQTQTSTGTVHVISSSSMLPCTGLPSPAHNQGQSLVPAPAPPPPPLGQLDAAPSPSARLSCPSPPPPPPPPPPMMLDNPVRGSPAAAPPPPPLPATALKHNNPRPAYTPPCSAPSAPLPCLAPLSRLAAASRAAHCNAPVQLPGIAEAVAKGGQSALSHTHGPSQTGQMKPTKTSHACPISQTSSSSLSHFSGHQPPCQVSDTEHPSKVCAPPSVPGGKMSPAPPPPPPPLPGGVSTSKSCAPACLPGGTPSAAPAHPPIPPPLPGVGTPSPTPAAPHRPAGKVSPAPSPPPPPFPGVATSSHAVSPLNCPAGKASPAPAPPPPPLPGFATPSKAPPPPPLPTGKLSPSPAPPPPPMPGVGTPSKPPPPPPLPGGKPSPAPAPPPPPFGLPHRSTPCASHASASTPNLLSHPLISPLLTSTPPGPVFTSQSDSRSTTTTPLFSSLTPTSNLITFSAGQTPGSSHGSLRPAAHKRRTLHWEKVRHMVAHTVWNAPDMPVPMSLIDEKTKLSLDEIFAEPDKPSRALHLTKKRRETVMLIDNKRTSQVGVMLKTSKLTYVKFVEAIATMDLKRDVIDNFLKCLPTPEEMKKVLDYTRKPGNRVEDLCEAGQLFYHLRHVGDLEDRMKVMEFNASCGDAKERLSSRLGLIRTACEQLIESTNMKMCLMTILGLGNHVNRHKEQAEALKLNSLRKLTSAKTPKNKDVSLLHLVVATVQDTMSIPEYTPEMRETAKLSFELLRSELQGLLQGAALVEKACRKQESLPVDARDAAYLAKLQAMMQTVVPAVEELEDQLAATERVFLWCAEYYCADDRAPPTAQHHTRAGAQPGTGGAGGRLPLATPRRQVDANQPGQMFSVLLSFLEDLGKAGKETARVELARKMLNRDNTREEEEAPPIWAGEPTPRG